MSTLFEVAKWFTRTCLGVSCWYVIRFQNFFYHGAGSQQKKMIFEKKKKELPYNLCSRQIITWDMTDAIDMQKGFRILNFIPRVSKWLKIDVFSPQKLYLQQLLLRFKKKLYYLLEYN